MTDKELIAQLAKQVMAAYWEHSPPITQEYEQKLINDPEERNELVSMLEIEISSMVEDALLEELEAHLKIG